MGHSATANILFGIVIHDPDAGSENPVLPWKPRDEDGEIIEGDKELEFHNWVADNFSGCMLPTAECPHQGDRSNEAQVVRDAYGDAWDTRREWLSANCPLEVSIVGYTDGYAREILNLKEWGVSSGYEPMKIDAQSLITPQEMFDKFRNTLSALGLAHLGEPSVLLSASYG